MIDLHERLSEFSYGYGVTRDVEQLLASVGIRAVPFLPSLLQEKQVGFDVGFGERGGPFSYNSSSAKHCEDLFVVTRATLHHCFKNHSLDFLSILLSLTDNSKHCSKPRPTALKLLCRTTFL